MCALKQEVGTSSSSSSGITECCRHCQEHQQRQTLHHGIYAVTDPGLTMLQAGLPGKPGVDDDSWHMQAIEHTTDMVAKICEVGVRVIQLRWKNVDAGYFLRLAERVSQAISSDVQLIINDRVDVYLAAVARGIRVDGVHIGQTDLPVPDVRNMIGSSALLGWSAALDTEIQQANDMRDLLDSIGVGPVRATATKAINRADVGFEGIAQKVQLSQLPVTAIGGIIPSDVEALVEAGAPSIAVISAIFSAKDPVEAAREFVERWNSATAKNLSQ